MRFTLISVAFLALAHSVAPGVHGAPAVVSDHTNSLVVRQDLVNTLVQLLNSTLASVLGFQSTISPQLIEQLAEQILQDLQNPLCATHSVLPRALSPTSDPTSSTYLTTFSPTSLGSAAATGQIGTSAVASSNSPSVLLSTPQASSTPPTRMRRQLPSSLPTSVLASIVASSSALQPVKSVPASALSSKLGSATSKPGTSQPTS